MAEEVKAVQVRKARQLFAMLDGATCRPQAVRSVYRGERTIEVRLAPARAAATRDRVRTGRNAALESMDADVRARFETLRAWRRDRASEQRVPPYVIFQDKTLLEIALAEPGDLERLGHIPGVGQTKLDRYGRGVLDALGQRAA